MTLSQYLVVEITSSCAGAYAGRQLAEAGLPVLRIEVVDRNPLETLPPFDERGTSIPYLSLNGKKDVIRVDMSDPRGRATVEALCSRSAVFLTDVKEFFDVRSSRVTCHIHPDNISGASDLPSTDILIQAMSGALSMTGPLEGPPTPIGIPIGDVAPGLFAAIGIFNGLLQDQPQTLEVHALDATVALISYLGCSYLVSGEEIGFVGTGHPYVTPYGAYRAKDGHIIVAPGFTQIFWQNLCRMLDRADLIDDPRFGTLTNRRKNRDALQEILDAAFSLDTVASWEERLNTSDVPNGPIRTVRQALAHPVTAARGMITDIEGKSFINTPLIDNTLPSGSVDREDSRLGWRQAVSRLGVAPDELALLIEAKIVKPVSATAVVEKSVKTPDISAPLRRAKNSGPRKIVDLTRMLAGPFATMILGDLGYDILKVEEAKSGDYTRRTPPYRNGMSAYFFSANRNKKSIIVDLKSAQGRQVILDLVKTADAVVENFRPGVMEHLGLSYADLAKANPAIVLVSINGFGSTGPLKEKTSFDLVAQAMSGAMALSATPEGEPIKPAIPLGDVGGGLYAALGVVRALLQRDTDGRGRHLEVSLLDGMLAMSAYVGEQSLLSPTESDHPVRFVPNTVFATADGYMAVSAYTDAAWNALCEALDWDAGRQDPRFGTMEKRSAAAGEINARIAEFMAQGTRAHWMSAFKRSKVPACEIANLQMVFDNVQLAARDMLPEIVHPLTGGLKTFGNPIRRPALPYRKDLLSPPQHGEQTETALQEALGYSGEKIDSLLKCGAIAGLTKPAH